MRSCRRRTWGKRWLAWSQRTIARSVLSEIGERQFRFAEDGFPGNLPIWALDRRGGSLEAESWLQGEGSRGGLREGDPLRRKTEISPEQHSDKMGHVKVLSTF